MRLVVLHNRIYRAFPELDGYNDERCRKFIRAAQRGWVRRVFHAAAIVLVSGLLLSGGLLLAFWLLERWNSGSGSGPDPFGPGLAVILLFITAAPVAGYVTRDWLLRRRVRWVLRTRGACSGCRYSLIGLPVSAAHTVTCPECSMESEVDPSLGELVLDEAGMGRFRPTPAPPGRLARVFTPRRVRALKKAAVLTAIVLGVGTPALWGGYELWLRQQAAKALAEKPGVEALMALVEANQPPGSEGGANAWDILQEAIALRAQADYADAEQYPEPEGEMVYPEFHWIVRGIPTDLSPEDVQRETRNEQKARRLLGAYRQHGVYEVLDRMARAPRVVPFMDVPFESPLASLTMPDLGQMRQFARVNAARMKLAADQGDLAEFAFALESTLALSRVGMLEPLLIQRLVGLAIESLAYGRLQALLFTHPSPEWLDAVDAAIARQRVTLSPAYLWEGERLYAVDSVAWVFMDPSRVRWNRASEEVSSAFYQESEGPIGTYARNRDEINARFRAIADLAAVPRWQRVSSPSQSEADFTSLLLGPVDVESDLPLVRTFAGALSMSLRSLDQSELARQAYPIQAALERYYVSRSAYPATLSELAPDHIPQLPIDPWTGEPWGYRLRAPDASPDDPRGYILYSFGTDGQDNGGLRATGSNGNFGALRKAFPGTDFIINDWEPPEQ